MSFAVILNLVCIVVFLLFVQRLSSSLRPGSLIHLVAEHAVRVIDQVYPQPYDAKREVPTPNEVQATTPTQVIAFSGRSGVVLAFSAAELAQPCKVANVVVELAPQVGDFIAAGDPLFSHLRRFASGDAGSAAGLRRDWAGADAGSGSAIRLSRPRRHCQQGFVAGDQ